MPGKKPKPRKRPLPAPRAIWKEQIKRIITRKLAHQGHIRGEGILDTDQSIGNHAHSLLEHYPLPLYTPIVEQGKRRIRITEYGKYGLTAPQPLHRNWNQLTTRQRNRYAKYFCDIFQRAIEHTPAVKGRDVSPKEKLKEMFEIWEENGKYNEREIMEMLTHFDRKSKKKLTPEERQKLNTFRVGWKNFASVMRGIRESL